MFCQIKPVLAEVMQAKFRSPELQNPQLEELIQSVLEEVESRLTQTSQSRPIETSTTTQSKADLGSIHTPASPAGTRHNSNRSIPTEGNLLTSEVDSHPRSKHTTISLLDAWPAAININSISSNAATRPRFHQFRRNLRPRQLQRNPILWRPVGF
jgi:hypothetical protein